MGKNLDSLQFTLGFRSVDSEGNVFVWAEQSGDELLLHRKIKNRDLETIRYPVSEKGVADMRKQQNKFVAESAESLPEISPKDAKKKFPEPDPEPLDLTTMLRIGSYFELGYSKGKAMDLSGIFFSQEKAFNTYWKSLVDEKKARENRSNG